MPDDPSVELLNAETKKLKDLLAGVSGGNPNLTEITKVLKEQGIEPDKKVIPKERYTIEAIKDVFLNRGYEWNADTRDYQMNIVGIRNKVSTVDIFNDTMCWIYWLNGKQIIKTAIYTSEPGLYYLQNPINSKGTAILACGQYKNAYGIRLHRGLYDALCQNEPVIVYRDDNEDKKYDYGKNAEEGEFGINIHRAAKQGEVEVVGKYSAGCQVFKNAQSFNSFMSVCFKRRDLYGNKFTYTLLHDDWFD